MKAVIRISKIILGIIALGLIVYLAVYYQLRGILQLIAITFMIYFITLIAGLILNKELNTTESVLELVLITLFLVYSINLKQYIFSFILGGIILGMIWVLLKNKISVIDD